MGNTAMKEGQLKPEIEKLVVDTFKAFDKNNSNAIDKEETLQHWFVNKEDQLRPAEHQGNV